MSRLGLRCNAQLPLTLERGKKNGNTAYHMVTANLGLGGAFVTLPFPLPEQEDVILRANLPDYGELEVTGKVIRNEKDGVAVKFTEMDSTARAMLWQYIKDMLLRENTCPYCGNNYPAGADECKNCTPGSDVLTYAYPGRQKQDALSSCLGALDNAIDGFNEKMDSIEKNILSGSHDPNILLKETSQAIYEVCDVCRELESAAMGNKELIKQRQIELRLKTNSSFSKSYFMNHSRTWPRGYPGDYKILEAVYRGMPLSAGIGYLLDQHFLATALGVAVRERLLTIKYLLTNKLRTMKNPSIVNIGCGSCREILELATEIHASGASVTCLDHDPDALNFSLNRLSYTPIQSQVSMRRYNALKMVSHERNLKEFGPQDVIYSIGLFDYLTDDVLVRLIRALYKLLNPKGTLIASFKDSDRYKSQEYHWFVDWDAFYQRTEQESRAIFKKAGIPGNALESVRDASGVIIFYTVTKA